MPALARRFLKTAFAFGILGILTGMHMSTAQHLGGGVMHRWYISAHTHIMLVGFGMLAANSLALCLLPAAPANSLNKPLWDVVSYWLITLGTLIRFSVESALGYYEREPHWMHLTITIASCASGTGLILFWLNQWPRIRDNDE